MTEARYRQAARLLLQAHHAVALTGAGISTPSGIPDFRSPGTGMWEGPNARAVISTNGFRADPESFFRWLGGLARHAEAAQPNPAHFALAQLEKLGRLSAVITQNVDSLHSRAGSRRVIEVHGNMRRAHCAVCGEAAAVEAEILRAILDGRIPQCRCGGILKPDVVLFGDPLPKEALADAENEARACDLMLVAGTSLQVSPAADLPFAAMRHGAALIIVNLTETDTDDRADVLLREDVARALPAIARLCEAVVGENFLNQRI